jgi:hypothetical protein
MEEMMKDLEDMFREVEDVSPIIEFNASSAGASGEGGQRGLFRAAQGGAAVLAQAVAEDLNKWHAKNEQQVAEYGSQHAERLRKSVENQQAEQEGREHVRTFVRERLYDAARDALATFQEESNRKRSLFKAKAVEVGNSIEAFQELQKRLEAAVSPVLQIQGEPPEQMLKASRASRMAAERKKQRSIGRRQRMGELENHLDIAFMEEAEQSIEQRKSELYEQCELRLAAMSQLEETQIERAANTATYEAMWKAAAVPSTDVWKWLGPAGLSQDKPVGAAMNALATPPPRFDASGNPILPKMSSTVEDAMVQTLAPQLHTEGNRILRQHRSKFVQSYLAKESGERAKSVGAELERWQLKTKIELLKELIQVSQTTHASIMDQLRSSLEVRDEDPDHLVRTLEAGNAFQRQRAEFFDGQVESAETAISTFCNDSIQQLLSQRRRTELASLKRWNDVGAGLNASLGSSWVSAQCQLVEELRRALLECHKSVKLPIENIDIDRGRKYVDTLSNAWKHCATSVSQQLQFLENTTKAMPATVESCAVTKAALVAVEAELERIQKRLKESSRQM